jgi:hypothetical protein
MTRVLRPLGCRKGCRGIRYSVKFAITSFVITRVTYNVNG